MHCSSDAYVEIFQVLSRKSRTELPPDLPGLCEEASGAPAVRAGWPNSGVVIEVANSIGVPLRFRNLTPSILRTENPELLFPLVTYLNIDGRMQHVVLEGRDDSKFQAKIVEGPQMTLPMSTIVESASHYEQAAQQQDLSRARAELNHAGVTDSQLNAFLAKHPPEVLIDIADTYGLASANVNGSGLKLAKVLLDDPGLLGSINVLKGRIARCSEDNRTIPVLLSEGMADYFSDATFAKQAGAHEHDDHHEHEHPHPFERLMRFIRIEKRDLGVIAGYSVIIGLISLVTPLSVNAIVSTISAGIFTLPIVVLSSIILVGLLLAGIIGIVEHYVVEVLQQRIFVNTAFEVSYKIPHAKQEALHGEYTPELLNRFFDVITVQKAMSKLLMDGLSAALVGISGLALLVFISPTLLSLGLIFIILSFIAVFTLGRGGLKTSVYESKKKYAVAAFLEDVARCMSSFKLTGTPAFVYKRVDELLAGYVQKRRAHFTVVVRQLFGFAFIRALILTGVLGVGGILVIERQITLGQLVATEIVIVSLVAALDKLFSQLENVYDLLTAMDKVGHITDLELERSGGTHMPDSSEPARVVMANVSYSYGHNPVLKGLDLSIEPGTSIALVGKSGAGKSTLAHLLVGIVEPKVGSVIVDDYDIRRLDLVSLRRHVGLVLPNDEIFDGTIWDNVVLGRTWITSRDVMRAMQLTRLDETFFRLRDGLQTRLVSNGKNLSTGQIRRLMIARALVQNPRVLILDEAFTGIEENLKLEIIKELFSLRKHWTIISITHDPEVVAASEQVCVLADGHIVERGAPHDLALHIDTQFSKLFPDLSMVLRTNLLGTNASGVV